LWDAEWQYDDVIKISTVDADKYFGYDSNKGKYFLSTISASSLETKFYQEANNTKLILANNQDPEDQILIYTFNSFQIGGEWFFRK